MSSVVDTLTRNKSRPTSKERALSLAGKTFHGEKLSGPSFAESSRLAILDSIINCLEGRFSNSAIASFKLWPNTPEGMVDFGDDEVALLTAHFSSVLVKAGVDTDQVETECTMFKSRILRAHKNNIQNLTWVQVNAAYKEDYSNIQSRLTSS